MRGPDEQTQHMFSYLSPEQRVPADDPLRAVPALTDEALWSMSAQFERLYSTTGRPSIPPEQLLRALLLQVLFTTAAAMLTTLTKALGEGRFDDKLKVFTIPRLLIIDEIGYLPIDRQAATLFFQLISRRYERGPMILTSNQNFGSWGDVFGDRVIASAILDRILHHATTVSIRGDSYRLKDKLKSGVVKPTTAGA